MIYLLISLSQKSACYSFSSWVKVLVPARLSKFLRFVSSRFYHDLPSMNDIDLDRRRMSNSACEMYVFVLSDRRALFHGLRCKPAKMTITTTFLNAAPICCVLTWFVTLMSIFNARGHLCVCAASTMITCLVWLHLWPVATRAGQWHQRHPDLLPLYMKWFYCCRNVRSRHKVTWQRDIAKDYAYKKDMKTSDPDAGILQKDIGRFSNSLYENTWN